MGGSPPWATLVMCRYRSPPAHLLSAAAGPIRHGVLFPWRHAREAQARRRRRERTKGACGSLLWCGHDGWRRMIPIAMTLEERRYRAEKGPAERGLKFGSAVVRLGYTGFRTTVGGSGRAGAKRPCIGRMLSKDGRRDVSCCYVRRKRRRRGDPIKRRRGACPGAR